MRASTIIILAVCLFSVAFANNKDTESANSVAENSKISAAESKHKRITLNSAAGEGGQPMDPMNSKKHKMPTLPKLPKIF